MNSNEFRDVLKTKVLLFDGGMGTELYNKGIFINKCYEELNLTNPDLIARINLEYINAGADVIETNTFGANRFKLAKYQLDDKLYDINFQAGKIAKQTAKSGVLVAGAIGPLGIRIEPLGAVAVSEAQDYFAEQIQPLVDSGVDLLIFETFIYIEELEVAIQTARNICDLPIIAQLTIDEDGSTLTGTLPKQTIERLNATDADVVGVNCTVGPAVMLSWLEAVKDYTTKPLSVMPNAGKPKNIDGRNIYLCSPEYLGEYAKHFLQSGASIIGGCCGTGPEHIRKMRNMIKALKPQQYSVSVIEDKDIDKSISESVDIKDKSRLARRIAEKKFVTLVELLSPHGCVADKEIAKARELYYSGIDAINIPDGPRASARMSALALAVKMKNEVGIEPVLHYVCRDRNVIGMQSDLLGAYALGVTNVLAITGDPPKLGNYPDATAVFDVDSIGLVNILSRLNSGNDIAGNPISSKTGFLIGVGANPGALNLDEEIRRLWWKYDAGAEYYITQPIFDVSVFETFLNKTQHIKIPVVAGLWPLTSVRNAEFMNNEIPGCNVPKSIIDKLAKYASNKEDSLKAGIEIAQKLYSQLMPMIAGVQVSAPFGRVQSVKELLKL